MLLKIKTEGDISALRMGKDEIIELFGIVNR